MDFVATVASSGAIDVQQRKELAELFGFESRNKYELSVGGSPVGYVAEQQKGILGVLLRQFLGHWRTFDLHVFDAQRNLVLIARHPFRLFFQRLEVSDPSGQLVGIVERRWGILSKRLVVMDAAENVLLDVSSGLFKVWTFQFTREGRTLATIQKKWGGLLQEAFTDADKFRIEVQDAALGVTERLLLVAAAIYIDLLYFEAKASR